MAVDARNTSKTLEKAIKIPRNVMNMIQNGFPFPFQGPNLGPHRVRLEPPRLRQAAHEPAHAQVLQGACWSLLNTYFRREIHENTM